MGSDWRVHMEARGQGAVGGNTQQHTRITGEMGPAASKGIAAGYAPVSTARAACCCCRLRLLSWHPTADEGENDAVPLRGLPARPPRCRTLCGPLLRRVPSTSLWRGRRGRAWRPRRRSCGRSSNTTACSKGWAGGRYHRTWMWVAHCRLACASVTLLGAVLNLMGMVVSHGQDAG